MSRTPDVPQAGSIATDDEPVEHLEAALRKRLRGEHPDWSELELEAKVAALGRHWPPSPTGAA
jgi:hypothetical protein